MTTLTSMCEMVCQIIQKKQEEKQIEEEQAANARYWKIPACCDDDDDDDVDYTIVITPVLSTEEPVDSLSMGDKHLDTIPATESNEVIKSSVEDLVPIPSTNSVSKAAGMAESSQTKPHLFLEELDVDVTSTIVVMIGKVWDVNALTDRYLSTDLVVSDSRVSF
uniref:Uncharacterized protein n=1 Tax=Tanacetum cinerariifolium TaxID=118510 RepID=A0A699JQR4_TANCI|nr:hypothetical protein [Tanacetum cinerariifolium]